MVGRFRSDEGIIYPFVEELSKIDKKLHLNIDFDSIIKEGFKLASEIQKNLHGCWSFVHLDNNRSSVLLDATKILVNFRTPERGRGYSKHPT